MGDSYKLTYFNIAARGEPIRFIFAYAGIPFEDERIQGKDWPALKKELQWGQLPILTINGNQQIAQSKSICRFLGNKFELSPSDPYLAAKCDEYSEVLGDFGLELSKLFGVKDEEKIAELKKGLQEVHIPKYFGNFERILEKNGKWLVGSSLTWIDIYIIPYIEHLEKHASPELLNSFPRIKNLKESVCSFPKVKAYLNKRTVS